MKLSINLLIIAAISVNTHARSEDLVKREELVVPSAYKKSIQSKRFGGYSVAFLGNSTFYITDGKEKIMVDGFLSRIRKSKSLLGKIKTDESSIVELFNELQIEELDAVAVGHSHHDHALDAPFLAERYGATVLSNRSYERIHEGAYPNFPKDKLITYGPEGGLESFGDFTIEMVPSLHAKSKKLIHQLVEGKITKTVTPPARFGKYNCGDVFAIHVSHPRGSIMVTTTAGAKPGALERFRGKVDVFFLAIGLLGKMSDSEMNDYFRDTVEAVAPRLVVPVHWDDFTIPVTDELTPISNAIDDLPRAIRFIENRCSGKCEVGIMEFKDRIYFPL